MSRHKLGLVVSLALASCATTEPASGTAAARVIAGETSITFQAQSGESVAAFQGEFSVAENRRNPNSPQIVLRYVRFPALVGVDGPPIVYLAGGPGGPGTGTARGERFPLFMAMRAFGDVIAFDQRGSFGLSDRPPECRSSVVQPAMRSLSDEEHTTLYRRAVVECAAFWRASNVDLGGYTTAESVADLEALRRHLGAEELTLWGISYGTHLALAAIKQMPDRIDRVILASVEGLDQTIKSPAATDAYFARLGVSAGVDDLPALMRTVHARLDDEPVLLEVPLRGGGHSPFLLQRRDMQMFASAMIADPPEAVRLIAIYQSAANGDFSGVAAAIGNQYRPGEPIRLSAMPLAMDRASGVTAARLEQVRREAQTSILGDYLNFPMPHILSELSELDLGDGFRANPRANTPTLILMGTLDGRLYPEEQRAATSHLRRATYVRVVNAGHNLFMVSPEIQHVMETFMRGEPIETHEIVVDPPRLP